jgi:FlgD Ig-like domain
MRTGFALTILTIVCTLTPGTGHAAWNTNGSAICTATANQGQVAMASDGAGGAILTWRDVRISGNGGNSVGDIYAQRVDGTGSVLWAGNGVLVCDALNDQALPQIACDGASGVVIAWLDHREGINNAAIYIQRVDAAGTPQWTTNGIPLCSGGCFPNDVRMIADGAGGAFVAWDDAGSGTRLVYAQWVDGTGTERWTPGGSLACTQMADQTRPTLVSDGAGGIILAWEDSRIYTDKNLYAQHMDDSGTATWAPTGVALCTASNGQLEPTGVSDDAGGAIVAWRDNRGNGDIYAQHLDGLGNTTWTTDGIVVCNATNVQDMQQITTDGTGGAIVAWRDNRAGNEDIYAQHVSATGTVLWATYGVAVCTSPGNQLFPAITSDGIGGANLAWSDSRFYMSSNYDIYAQHIDDQGSAIETANGVPLCTAVGFQSAPVITTDGFGGAIVGWPDSRLSTDSDVYASRLVSAPTGVGDTPSIGALGAIRNHPNPFSGMTSIEFRLAVASDVAVDVIDVAGRRVRTLSIARPRAGWQSLAFDGRDDAGRPLASGVYFCRVRANGTTVTHKMVIAR